MLTSTKTGAVIGSIDDDEDCWIVTRDMLLADRYECLLKSALSGHGGTPLPLPPTRKTSSLQAILMMDGERGQSVREARDTVV